MKYPFKCIKCNYKFLIEIPASEYDNQKDKIKCPKCNSKAKRIFEAPPVIFKGAGWFRDHLYGITEREMQRNKDLDLKLEDQVKSGKIKFEEAQEMRS